MRCPFEEKLRWVRTDDDDDDDEDDLALLRITWPKFPFEDAASSGEADTDRLERRKNVLAG